MASINRAGERKKWAASVKTASQVNRGYGSDRSNLAAQGVNGSLSPVRRKAATSGPVSTRYVISLRALLCEHCGWLPQGHLCSRSRAGRPRATRALHAQLPLAAARLSGRIHSNPPQLLRPPSARPPFLLLGPAVSVCHSFSICITLRRENQEIPRLTARHKATLRTL